MIASRVLLAFALILIAVTPALAQEAPPKPTCPCPPPEPPPPPLTGSLSAGLSVTSGNTDTSAFNLAFNLTYDPKTQSLFKADAFYLRSTSAGAATTDRTAANLRYQHKVTDRLYAFAQLGYQRDRFKNVVYLFTPMVGGGYYLIKEKNLELTADGSVGGAFEKNDGFSPNNTGAFSVGQAFRWNFTPSAALTEKASGLWKTNDTSDAFYHFEVGLSASLAKSFELKAAYVVDYKNKPLPATLKKSDTALIAALVYRF